MTLKTRNIILYGLFIVTSCCVILYLYLLIFTDFSNPKILAEIEVAQGRYLGMSWKTGPGIITMNIFSAGLAIVLAWLGAFFFIRVFRLVSSPQLFFIILYWICLGAGIIRMVNMAAIIGGEGIGFRIAVSRADIAFRILGILSIFGASLHTVGIKSQQQGNILGIILVISFSLSYFFPLNMSIPEQSLLFGTAGTINADVFCLVAGLLALLNYLKNALNTMDSSDWVLMVPILLLVTGHQFQAVSGEWWMILLSWSMILTGSVWLARRYMTSLLWY